MDYLETVLLRQRALWSALVQGRTQEQEESAEGLTIPADGGTAGLALEGRSQTTASAAIGWAGTFGAGRESAPGEEDCFLPARVAQALEERGRAAQAEAMNAAQGRGRGTSEEAGFAGRWVASHADTAQTQGNFSEETESGGPGDNGLRLLSLALERDTRRFDGGFSLY